MCIYPYIGNAKRRRTPLFMFGHEKSRTSRIKVSLYHWHLSSAIASKATITNAHLRNDFILCIDKIDLDEKKHF